MQHNKQLGITAGQSIPKIATNIMALKHAQATNDGYKVMMEKEKLANAIATMKMGAMEKEYNKAVSDLAKSQDATRTATLNLDLFKQGNELQLQREQNVHLGKMQDDTQVQEKEMSAQGHTQGLEVLDRTGEIKANALTAQLLQLEQMTGRLPEGMLDDIRRKVADLPDKSESEVMLELIRGRTDLTQEEKTMWWGLYNKINVNDTGSSGSSGSPSFNMTESKIGAANVINKLIHGTSVGTVDKGGSIGDWMDTTKSLTTNPAEYYKTANDMAQEAIRSTDLSPADLRLYIQKSQSTALSKMEALRKQGQDVPRLGDPITYKKPPHRYTDDDEAQAELERRTILESAHKILLFFQSDAGKEFSRWLDKSADARAYQPYKFGIPDVPKEDVTPPQNGTQGGAQGGTSKVPEDTTPPQNGGGIPDVPKEGATPTQDGTQPKTTTVPDNPVMQKGAAIYEATRKKRAATHAANLSVSQMQQKAFAAGLVRGAMRTYQGPARAGLIPGRTYKIKRPVHKGEKPDWRMSKSALQGTGLLVQEMEPAPKPFPSVPGKELVIPEALWQYLK